MCHVLIIEDEFLVASVIWDIAVDAGATSVDVANSPSEAFMLATTRRPDIILSDFNILEGTGPDAAASIRDHLGEIPVIFITGSPEQCAHCAYAAAILTKPADAQDLVRHFQAALLAASNH